MELLLHRPGSAWSWNRQGPHSELPQLQAHPSLCPCPGTPCFLGSVWKSSGVREGRGKGGIFSHNRILVIKKQDAPSPHPDKNARGDSLGGLAQGAFGM